MDKGIVSVFLPDSTTKTHSVTNKTTCENLVGTLLSKTNFKPDEHKLLVVSKTNPEGVSVDKNDLILEIQQSWGEKNINLNRFKLVHINSFVKVEFRGVTEITDGVKGGTYASQNMNADAFCEMMANDYGLSKKKKYCLIDIMSQGMEEKLLQKEDKPLQYVTNAQKNLGIPVSNFHFVFTIKKESWMNKLMGIISSPNPQDGSSAPVTSISVSSPQLLEKAAPIDFSSMPDEETVNQQLLQILSELNITGDLKEKMMKDDLKRKWILICQHKTPDVHDSSEKNLKEPHQYIDALSKKSDLKTLVALRVELNTASLTWIKQFLECSGLGALQVLLTKIQQRPTHTRADNDEDIQLECIRCLRGILNTEPGLKAVYGNAEIVLSIVHGLHGESEKLKNVSAELLAGLCIVSQKGHALVLESLDKATSHYKEQSRFQYLVHRLSDSRHHFEFRINIMILINAITNAPENIIMRAKIREEFAQRGLVEIMKAIQMDCPPELTTQLQVYMEEAEADSSDASSVYQQKGFDMNNPSDLFAEIQKQTKDSHVQLHFTSILRSLMVIPSERPEVWAIIEVLSQSAESLEGTKTNPSGIATCWRQIFNSLEASVGIPAPKFGSSVKENELEEEKSSLKKLLEEKDKQISSLNNRILKSDVDFAEAAKTIQDYKSAISTLEAKNTSFQSQLLSGNEKDKALHMEVQAKIEDIGILTEQIRQLREENKVVVSEYSKENDQFKAKIKELENINAELSRSSSSEGKESYSKISQLESEIERLKKNEISLQEQLKSAQAKASATPSTAPPPPASMIPSVPQTNTSAPPPAPSFEAAAPPPPSPGFDAPPPPPPGMGGPPPPPPGMGGPPPPPGFAIAPALPAKKVIKPNVPLKQFNWTKIPDAKAADTIWKTVSEDGIKINFNELESLFQKKSAPTPVPVADKPEAPKKSNNVTLLEFNRANNIAIMLARMKLSHAEIKSSILNMDEEKLSIDNLRALKQFVPTEEELELIKEFDGDANTLGNPEKYFKEISSVPQLSARLEAMIFKRRFLHDIEELKPEVESITNATKEFKKSESFAEILRICLAIGNYLNGSTFRGGAYGFKLDALLKLSETKSQGDGPQSLLHYLSKYLEETKSSLLDFLSEIPSAATASRVSLQTTMASIREIQNGVTQVKKLLSNIESSDNGQFVTKMNSFLTSATPTMEKVLELARETEDSFKSLLRLYGEDETMSPEEFFSIPIRFSADLKKAQAENKTMKDKSKNVPAGAQLAMPALQQGELDNALRGLKEGNAFKKKRENRRSLLMSDDVVVAVATQAAAKKPLVLPKNL